MDSSTSYVNIFDMPILHEIISGAEQQINKKLGVEVFLKPYLQNDLMTLNQRRKMRLRELLCNEYGCTWNQVISKSRKHALIAPRFIYMFVCHKVWKHTSTQVGFELNRDHGTVLSGCDTVQGYIDVQDPLVEKMNKFIKIINHELQEDQNADGL